MDCIIKELGILKKNILPTSSTNTFTVVVHTKWLKRWLKNLEVDNSMNNINFTLQPNESVPYPWRKIFIKVINKKVSKVLPLPRYKLNEDAAETVLTFSQLLQYVSQNNHRNLWKESYKKYCQNIDNPKESAVVNLLEHDQLLTEVILRLYGCNIIRIRNDGTGKFTEYKELTPNKYVSKSYETHVNLLAAMFTLETDNNYFVVYRDQYDNSLLDCLNFCPNLIHKNYTQGLFIVYQLLNVAKAMNDRGLSMGMLNLHNIYLTENLWLQVLPSIINNIHTLEASLINEHNKAKQNVSTTTTSIISSKKTEEWLSRNDIVHLEKLYNLWVRGRISNLDYLLHLNTLAGRNDSDPQAHFMVPWVTDFASRCGKNWRDLSKSKYRLNKGDRQLDMTYDVTHCGDQIPHHVTDPLSDITCYVYLARRTPKEVLCKHVRNKWVPAEYPGSIQRMQEWTPDECIPEFYTDPAVFKSIHEDLPDLGIPVWASCVEDFITKHREALESAHISENLHHWIDITFGYKLTGSASIKAKNVCLSLVDGHTVMRRGTSVQLLRAPHPPRMSKHLPTAPPRLHWLAPKDTRRSVKNDSSDEASDEEEESTSLPQHVSRLSTVSNRVRSRHQSSSRARSLSKTQTLEDSSQPSSSERASSHSRHYRVQRSELGKGVIYLPKEFNPIASIQALEVMDNFKTKCFFSKAIHSADRIDKHKESISTLNLYPVQECKKDNELKDASDETAFTNHMFLASYDQNYLKKFTQDPHLESMLKERKNRALNTRYTTDASVYKQFVTESRKQDMLAIGCLIVEIFLHNYIRPLRTNSDNFPERFNSCRIVLKHNFNLMPKCVSYIASMLLNVEPLSLSFKNELVPKTEEPKRSVVTDKGLPPPTPSQLLQPLLMQHLVPFPPSFNVLYKLLSTLHEYEVTSNDLNILYMYECDGIQCEQYQNLDKTKHYFSQKIAEGKIQACISIIDLLLNQLNSGSQFNIMDIFLSHYIELLKSKDTSVLAAWYLFDTVSKSLGPAETRNKLLKYILNLYDEDESMTERLEHKTTDFQSAITPSGSRNKQKFVKLYHNIFLLQLMVRFGLQCFLDNFTQHLVEAVGGYKDFTADAGTPGHLCQNKTVCNKKPRYSDETVKNALSTTDIFSPDTSYGSEHITTPNIEKASGVNDTKDNTDNRSENDLFHFETDKERLPSRSSRSKSPAESIESYTLNTPNEQNLLTSSPTEVFSPSQAKDDSPSTSKSAKDLSLIITTDSEAEPKGLTSPTIEIPKKNTMFTSYLHFADDDVKEHDQKNANIRQIKSLEFSKVFVEHPTMSRSLTEENLSQISEPNACKISDVSSESLIWLAHRLGPVLTCRYITRNLLKMLTLCYIGKENLAPLEGEDRDEFDSISVANSKVIGDTNAIKVIKCLTTIVAMYGEQLIIFQYLPHAGELIASCRRRLSTPLEGGVVACLHLLKYLIPYMSDGKVMEQLQDTFLKSILQPAIRLASTARCTYPNGATARSSLARKLLDALYVIALRVGPEMTRKHLCVPALQRFFLAFDKASGKTDNWPKQEEGNVEKTSDQESSSDARLEGFLEICRDGSTAEWKIQDGLAVRSDLPDLACSPPWQANAGDSIRPTAQEELQMVFNEELAYQAYTTFAKFAGTETMERCLKNCDTIHALGLKYEERNNLSPCYTLSKLRVGSSSDEPIPKKIIDISATVPEANPVSSCNSFGSNVTLVGNRINVSVEEKDTTQRSNFHVVAHNMDNGSMSNRHLRGDWLIYWEHEIGRADKDARFNLKQIKLQTFVGHTHSVKSIHCLDNENSFMSGSKDKTVKLWSMRNQGDGNATTQCNWTYTGHKKGVLSLTFLESLRLAVSTDSVVHIWDPFMESVVSQLDNIKSPISIVRPLGSGSATIIAATDTALKLIDARAPYAAYDLKLPVSTPSLIRCMSVSESGAWVGCGLASGHAAIIDIRSGAPVAHWRASEAEVLRMAAVDERRVLTSGLDQVTALWRVDDGELIAHLKGTTEPVHCLSVYYNEVISGTTNNRIGVHTSLDQEASFSTTKLRSDTFRGVLTCMAVLPLNRLLLLGSDNGSVSLLC